METNVYDASALVVVCGWVNLVKAMVPAGWSKWMPVAAIACGVLYALHVRPAGAAVGIWTAILTGATVGLGAAGTFSGAKALSGA